MQFYAKKTEYFMKSSEDGLFVGISQREDKRGILIKYLSDKGKRLFFSIIHENEVSACHLKALALDFLEDSVKDFSGLHL